MSSQFGMSTVGHNIANANTVGYSRQNTIFDARAAQQVGNFYVGQGADAIGVQRAYSQYLTSSVWNATSSQSRANIYSGLTGIINNQLSGSANLQTALDGFFGAVNDLANTPTDTATRQALLGKATSLTSTYKSLASQFGQLDQQVNQQIAGTVTEINSYTKSIANLNAQIQKAYADGGVPNDLLDARDAVVQQLSADVGVSVVTQDDHSINVFIGNGQSLVTGTTSFDLSTAGNAYDPLRTEVVSPGGTVISSQIGSGALGAMIDFRSNVLDPARNQLGRAAIGLASVFNAQHAQGVDLNGDMGGDFFSVGTPTVLTSSTNKGNATAAASISDVSKLTASDYIMSFDGTNWSLKTTNGASVAMNGTGTAADPFVTADGLTFTVGGTPVKGDSFQIQPTRDAAENLSVAVTDTNKIAASGPLVAGKGSANTGKAALGGMKIGDPADPALKTPVSIVFTSPTTYTIDGGPPQTYTSGTPISYHGWELTLTGVPAANDSFTVGPAGTGSGDNGNALALGDVANKGVLDGGVTTVGKAYSQLTAQVGTAGAQAMTQLTTQNSIYNQALGAQQSVSGVNMDEEAANLIRFQQAYQASAQVINTATAIFNSLLSAVGG
jgi:flagellar hook-associated protein 1 FlgK